MKPRSPCCNAKTTDGGAGLRRCSKCGGRYDAQELASGRIEGGTAGRRPDERLLKQESGEDRHGAPIRTGLGLRGGL